MLRFTAFAISWILGQVLYQLISGHHDWQHAVEHSFAGVMGALVAFAIFDITKPRK